MVHFLLTQFNQSPFSPSVRKGGNIELMLKHFQKQLVYEVRLASIIDKPSSQ